MDMEIQNIRNRWGLKENSGWDACIWYEYGENGPTKEEISEVAKKDISFLFGIIERLVRNGQIFSRTVHKECCTCIGCATFFMWDENWRKTNPK